MGKILIIIYSRSVAPATEWQVSFGKSENNTRWNVRVEVFNQAGQLITTLVDGIMEAGNYQVTWNGRSSSGSAVSSGTYLYH
ncbi:MAG: hypothetical protein KAX28_09770 [Candidatus Marinimicrobia bacterium]|nr:hypothetical protein [Candidatus Neomarinimicrobiota bacterium]